MNMAARNGSGKVNIKELAAVSTPRLSKGSSADPPYSELTSPVLPEKELEKKLEDC